MGFPRLQAQEGVKLRAFPIVVIITVAECVEGFVDDTLRGVLHEVCVLLNNVSYFPPVPSVVGEA